MPVYEYRCTRCQHTFERYQMVGEAAPECPECGGAARKVYASVGLIFKGSGFHTTDYRKTPSGNGDKSSPAAEPAASTASGSSPATSASPAAPSKS